VSRVEIVVTLAGIAAIAWVNWYFFIAGRDHVARSAKRDERDLRPEQQS